MLVYTSEPLDRDLEVIGPVEMVLYAASSARDTDFFVRLCDVYPDGRSIFLTEGIIRARYRGSVEGESVELLEPGEVAEYRFRCYPVANVFRRGHRIRLDVTSSSFPRFSRNLNTGEDVGTGTRMEVAQQTAPAHGALPVARPAARHGVVTGDGGFPTYEAERALEEARAAGIEPVPLAGTPSPAAPGPRRRGRRGGAAAPDGRAAAARSRRRCARRSPAELERSTGRARRPGDGDPRHERRHARARDLLPLPARPGRRGRRAGSLLLLRGPDPRRRRDARSTSTAAAADGWRWDAEALERAIGPRTSALLLCNPGNPTGHVPVARRRSPPPSRSRSGTASLVVTDEAYEAALWDGRDAHLGLRPRGRRRRDPQPRQEPVDAAAAARTRFRPGARRVAACARTLEWDCLRVNLAAQEAALAALEGPRDWLDAVHAGARRRPCRRPRRRRRDARALGRRPRRRAVPLRPCRLGRARRRRLARAGLPVVDGVHFQAPGYARLPFGGAAQAEEALAEALARWAAAVSARCR